MTNEGVWVETDEDLDDERSSAVAYVGRASFRMVHTPVPGNDNHEHTLRIRIPASRWETEEPPKLEPPPVRSPLVAVLVARLEVPRWILATMTLLVFAGGVLVATSIAGAARPTSPRTVPVVASATPVRPMLALLPTAPAPVAPAAAAPRERTVAARPAAKPAPKPAPVRRPRKSVAPPTRSSAAPRPEAITSGWVDPFAQ